MNEENISSKKMYLDLKISKILRELEGLKKRADAYRKNMNEIVSLLKEQKKLDFKKYSINIEKNSDVKKIFNTKESFETKTTIFDKLNLSEKEFIKKHNYDYELDIYNLFNQKNTPSNDFTEEWKKIQTENHNKSLNDFYKDRDWN